MPRRSTRNEGSRPYARSKATRLRWTPELHRVFVKAIEKNGGLEKATPKQILHMMNVAGLNISHVKSHLQTYRGRALNDMKQIEARNEENGDNTVKQDDDAKDPPSNATDESQAQDSHTLRRTRRESEFISSTDIECNQDTMHDHGPQLGSKDSKSSDQHPEATRSRTPSEEMEGREDDDDLSLSLSL